MEVPTVHCPTVSSGGPHCPLPVGQAAHTVFHFHFQWALAGRTFTRSGSRVAALSATFTDCRDCRDRLSAAAMDAFVEPIKQYPGQVQVNHAVKVEAPGRHFTGLTAAEQKAEYTVTAVEYQERHPFERHQKAWGAPHTGPGIRFV